MLYYLLAFVVFVLDQLTKWLVVSRLEIGDQRPVIGEFFQITSSRNRGAAFSILQDQRWFFLSITVVIVAGVVWYMQRMLREGKKLLPVGLSLILGGAIGNFADRALFGEVVDFLQFRFRFSWFGHEVDYTYPIFNLADSAIVVGVCIILLDALRSWLKERKERVHDTIES